jgi:phosphatidylglycerol---prolipoprotein diacylglyceryl transferase
MRQTLFYIPNEIPGLPLPVFGFGLLLLVWAVASAGMLLWLVRRQGWNADSRAHLPMMALFGLAILFLLPRMLDEQGRLPVRGFGVTLLVAVGAATALAMHRARRMRVDPEIMLSLVIWLFVPGIVGARLFYIIEYWDDFRKLTDAGTLDVVATLAQLGNVAQGGLVVYKIPVLPLADLVAPSLALAQGLGRIGCFLNGCCFGGLCELPWSVTFPPDSPPYVRQVQEGQFYGLRIASADGDSTWPVIAELRPGTPAADSTLKIGDRVTSINGADVATLADAQRALSETSLGGGRLAIETSDGDGPVVLRTLTTAERSLPVHPTQIYSTIDGLVICLFLLAVYPYRRRDGETAAWLLTLYPTTRFLMEMIRTDEPGMFGTGLTISQLVSLGVLACAAALWIYLRSRPTGSVLETAPADRWIWTLQTA